MWDVVCLFLFQTTDGHQSSKASKVVFVAENQVFTTGFSRISDRQYALWDIVSG